MENGLCRGFYIRVSLANQPEIIEFVNRQFNLQIEELLEKGFEQN